MPWTWNHNTCSLAFNPFSDHISHDLPIPSKHYWTIQKERQSVIFPQKPPNMYTRCRVSTIEWVMSLHRSIVNVPSFLLETRKSKLQFSSFLSLYIHNLQLWRRVLFCQINISAKVEMQKRQNKFFLKNWGDCEPTGAPAELKKELNVQI